MAKRSELVQPPSSLLKTTCAHSSSLPPRNSVHQASGEEGQAQKLEAMCPWKIGRKRPVWDAESVSLGSDSRPFPNVLRVSQPGRPRVSVTVQAGWIWMMKRTERRPRSAILRHPSASDLVKPGTCHILMGKKCSSTRHFLRAPCTR